MSYQLGVDLGTTYTAAAVRREGDVRIVHLGTRSAAIPSAVLLKEDESFLVGEAAQRRGASEPERVAREFKRRIGDTTPLILGSTPYSAEALMARLLRWVVDEVTQREGGPPASVVVTHPANWGEYKKGLLNQAIRLADIDHAMLITEPEAAALHYASQERIETGSVIAIYDLGGGTFDAAILRKTEGGFTYLGTPEGIERLGGIDFDEAVFNHARRSIEAAGASLDATDPQTVTALRRLRDECTEAKEALSSDSDVSLPVIMPSMQTEVRLTRTELEAMIRPSLADTIGAMQRAARGAGLEMADIDAILLVGGSSRIPLVSELVASQLERPVVLDAHPKHAIALGAALWDQGVSAEGFAAANTADQTPAAPVPAPPEVAPVAEPPVAPVPASPEVAPVAEPPAAAAPPPGAVAAAASDSLASTIGMEAAAGAAPPHQPPAAPPTSNGGGSKRMLLIGGAVAAIAAIAIIAVAAFSGSDDPVATFIDLPTVEASAVANDIDDEVVVAVAPTATTAPEPTVAPELAATPLPEPTALPSPTAVPTATPLPFPPETRRSQLNTIALVGATYEVGYDTLNYDPVIGGAGTHHLHFHWDIYPPDTVGTNAATQNPWTIWDTRGDGALVFDQFGPGTAPAGATAICAVVADSAHAIDNIELATDTVSCIDLP